MWQFNNKKCLAENHSRIQVRHVSITKILRVFKILLKKENCICIYLSFETTIDLFGLILWTYGCSNNKFHKIFEIIETFYLHPSMKSTKKQLELLKNYILINVWWHRWYCTQFFFGKVSGSRDTTENVTDRNLFLSIWKKVSVMLLVMISVLICWKYPIWHFFI